MLLLRRKFMRFLLFTLISALALAALCPSQVPVVLREDFREVEAHIPVESVDLSCEFLSLQRLGPGARELKLSFHPNVANDPHYVWNGECDGPTLLAFGFRSRLDLSSIESSVRLRTKVVGESKLHLALQADGKWYAAANEISDEDDWTEHEIVLADVEWRLLDAKAARLGETVAAPTFNSVTSIGFASPVKPNSSSNCTRLDWFEICSTSAQITPERGEPFGGFFEADVPLLRSAMVVRGGLMPNRTRRGVIVHVGGNTWGCFDPDLLRWSAFWTALPDAAPISLDSMAAVSYPARSAKATQPPHLVGEIFMTSFEQPGVSRGRKAMADPRTAKIVGKSDSVGPLPAPEWEFKGVTLSGRTPVIHYSVSGCKVDEILHAFAPSGSGEGSNPKSGSIGVKRLIRIAPSTHDLVFRIGQNNGEGGGHAKNEKTMVIPASKQTRTVSLVYSPNDAGQILGAGFPEIKPAAINLGAEVEVQHPDGMDNAAASVNASLLVRSLKIPQGPRKIRPTDIGFLANGDALITTLDGDLWRLSDPEQNQSTWRRVATGLFEPMDIEIGEDDAIYVLGRDQVSRLYDDNNDGQIDRFMNASNAFLQTLHTRDFATSLALDPDGSFLIAKGGIMDSGGGFNELSRHRGSILRLPKDGTTADVLAVGLRIPFLGRRDDGSIFASDQQGHFVPSTPLHRVGPGKPFLGFDPTKHDEQPVASPVLWFPYQANRSGAGFTSLSPQAFPSAPGAFTHVSWNGRLFPIQTPDEGSDFAWRLPLQLDFPTLNAATHPITGTLYVIGLGISGYLPTTKNKIGLAGVRQVGNMVVPKQVHVEPRRLQIDLDQPLLADQQLLLTGMRFFNLRRTASYGSGHYRWDGKPGEHVIVPSAMSLNRERLQLEWTLPNIYQADVLVLNLFVVDSSAAGTSYPLEVYLKPNHLPEPNAADLAAVSQRETAPDQQLLPGNAAAGKKVFNRYACAGCHSLNGEKVVGPPLNGVHGRHRELSDIDGFLRQALLNPNQVIADGYPAVMPPYAGVILAQELEHLIAYLKTLK
jgi:mono/diheme cytochrome c family protein